MPPDLSKAAKPSLEAKRARGELACAECRRLKLRCDKKIPCGSCIRRGCSPVCPNGLLSGSHGSRYVLADTEQMYRKLIEMSERIRQLEDALQIASPGVERHPLLTDNLRAIKFGIDDLHAQHAQSLKDNSLSPEPEPSTSAAATLHESLGTLALTEGGSTRFIGSSGGTEIMLLHEASLQEDLDDGDERFNTEQPNDTWPFIHLPRSADKLQILNETLDRLPTKERVSALCEAFLENVSWFYCIVDRSQLVEELIPAIYDRLHTVERMDIDAHDLSLLLVMCALGAAADLTQDPANIEGYEYYQAARTALALKSCISSPTLAAIQSLFMMGAYTIIASPLSSLESPWMTFTAAKALATTMGLHRDPSRWNLGSRINRRRRQVFWQLFAFDAWHNLGLGRPTVFNLHTIDCKFPDVDGSSSEEGPLAASYWSWSYGFVKEELYRVAYRLSGSEPLKLSDVLELDRHIRESAVWPPSGDRLDSKLVAVEGPRNVMRRFLSLVSPEFLLLFVHRNFFAKAIRDAAVDPLQTPYAACYLSAFRSSLMILKLVRNVFSLLPGVSSRCWFIWHHSLCALIVISSVIAVRPNSSLASVALAELGVAVEMYEKAATYAKSLQRILPIVLRLRSKAYRAYFQNREVAAHVSQDTVVTANLDGAGVLEFTEELAMLGGDARTVKASQRTSPSPPSTSPQAVNMHFQSDAQVFAELAHDYRSTDSSTPSGSSTQYSPPPAPEQPMYAPSPVQYVDTAYAQPQGQYQAQQVSPTHDSQQMYYNQNIHDLFNMTTPVHPAMQPSFFANAPLAYPDASTQIAGTDQDAWSVFMSESVFASSGQVPQNQTHSYSLGNAMPPPS